MTRQSKRQRCDNAIEAGEGQTTTGEIRGTVGSAEGGRSTGQARDEWGRGREHEGAEKERTKEGIPTGKDKQNDSSLVV